MNISIIGTGYVGLVTGVGLSCLGHRLICVDINKKKVEKINKGESPIYEEGLEALLKKSLKNKTISATTDIKSAILKTDITFIAVPTPSKENGDIDLSYIEKISQKIGEILAQKTTYHLVAIKSTVAPETTFKVVLPLIERFSKKRAGKEFGLCMNPEFLREGEAINDFMKPDRVIIGQLDKKSGDMLCRIYRPFKTEILRTSLNNAEMIKYANNALLATLISFSNEIAGIAEQIPGANAFDILKGVHLDKRLNPVVMSKRTNPAILGFISPGCGFGGSCFPKDIKALISFSNKKNLKPLVLSGVLEVNKKQPLKMADLAEKKLGVLKGKKIAILGLAFKPGTDDTRESPAIPIIKSLFSKGAEVFAFDPVVNAKNIKPPLKNLKFNFSDSLQNVIKNKDACLLVTGWPEFKKITPEFLKRQMKNPLLIDGRGFYNNKNFSKKICYAGIGLGTNKKGGHSS